MMSFYEEFGIRNDASIEEVRQAYKTLARVLHPDNQTDEKLKAAAARQMKRLNEIFSILADSSKRRSYDQMLVSAAYPNAPLHWARMPAEPVILQPDQPGLGQSVLQHWSWVLIGCMILGSGYWCLTARGPAPLEFASNGFSVAAEPAPLDGQSGAPAADSVLEPHVSPFPVPQKYFDGARLLSAGVPDIPPPRLAAVGGQTLTASTARLPDLLASESPLPAPRVHAASFAGEWFYVPAIEKPDPYLYAPLDIDLKLTEENGVLNGQYRGEYKVPDASVPQDVFFQVQGKSAAGTSASLEWTSNDGASGEIDLNLRQPNLMKVTWWTTRQGRSPSLSSGAATLLRQQTR